MSSATRQSAAQALPTAGQVIAGKYAIVKVLGEGGMGVVFEATHVKLRQRVALKMLLPQMLEHEIIKTRFEREARASGQLRNRHAARVMDVDVTPEGLPYMVMEFLEGHDLQQEIVARGRLPYEEVVDYILQACSAMMEAHQLGIVHRDLKPANLFLSIENDSRDMRIVKVLDFGISKVQNEGDARLTEAESVIGTAMYMSPEQLRSSGGVDGRSDIWSLGIILYELLAGRPPWIGSPTQLAAAIVSEDAPDVRTYGPVPDALAAVVTKALKRNPSERFADVKELALALAPFAPPSGPGRVLADGLLNGSSGMFPRVSVRPPAMESAPTMVQAAAVSQSNQSTGNAAGGTAPGWSQHSQKAAPNRTIMIGFAAFVIGLLVVGGSAMAWLRWRSSNAPTTATAPQTSSTTDTSSAAAAASPGSPEGLAASETLPRGIDPAPPVTGQGVAAPPPSSVASARPRVPVARPSSSPPPVARPAAPPSRPPTAPAPTVNPLTL